MIGLEAIVLGSTASALENRRYRPKIEISMPSSGVLAGDASSTAKCYFFTQKADNEAGKSNGFDMNLAYEAVKFELPIPDDTTLKIAKEINDFLINRNIKIDHLAPTKIGGVSIELKIEDSYYNIEVDNDRDAVFYKETPGDIPRGWDFTYAQLMQKLVVEFG